MPSSRMFGLILLIGGMIVLAIAYQQSGTFGDETKHFFTGNYRDRTTWMIVIGGIATLLGFVSFLIPSRRAVI